MTTVRQATTRTTWYAPRPPNPHDTPTTPPIISHVTRSGVQGCNRLRSDTSREFDKSYFSEMAGVVGGIIDFTIVISIIVVVFNVG